MNVAYHIHELLAARSALPRPVGLVPTMGYLHQGHLSLVDRARSENASVIVSVFVNPTQFGPGEDLASYPSDVPRDLDMLRASGADLVFVPSRNDIYPPDFQTYVQVEKVSKALEGTHRPGHFRGVATVVAKLFNLTLPQRAYFGQKDAQQVRVIKQMVKDLAFPLEVIVCPIVREDDGLAMSSRNSYLTPEQRLAAPVLYRSLMAVRGAHEAGERDAEHLRLRALEVLAQEPMAQVEYVSVADADTLEELAQVNGPALCSLAVRIGRTRLIDNITLK